MNKDTVDRPFDLPINWSSEQEIPPCYANQAMINHTEDIFTLMFFDLHPPVFWGSQNDIAAQLSSIKEIKPTCVAKLYLPPSLLPSLMSTLQENYSKYLEERSESKKDCE